MDLSRFSTQSADFIYNCIDVTQKASSVDYMWGNIKLKVHCFQFCDQWSCMFYGNFNQSTIFLCTIVVWMCHKKLPWLIICGGAKKWKHTILHFVTACWVVILIMLFQAFRSNRSYCIFRFFRLLIKYIIGLTLLLHEIRCFNCHLVSDYIYIISIVPIFKRLNQRTAQFMVFFMLCLLKIKKNSWYDRYMYSLCIYWLFSVLFWS